MKGSPGCRPDKQMIMRLGTSTNMFNRKRGSNTKPSYAEKLEAVARAGFDSAEIHFCDSVRPEWHDQLAGDDWERSVDAAAETAAAHSLPVVQAKAPYLSAAFVKGYQPSEDDMTNLCEMLRRSVAASAKLGVKNLILQPLNDTVNCEYDTAVELATNRDFYAPIVELCMKNNIGVVFENTCKSPALGLRRTYGENPEDLMALVDFYGDPRVGICWNFGHANFMISDQPRALRKVGNRLHATHLEDNRGMVDSHLIPFVGGNIKWERIVPCLREIGFDGDMILDAPSYTRDFPEELKDEAVKFALTAGRYLLSL